MSEPLTHEHVIAATQLQQYSETITNSRTWVARYTNVYARINSQYRAEAEEAEENNTTFSHDMLRKLSDEEKIQLQQCLEELRFWLLNGYMLHRSITKKLGITTEDKEVIKALRSIKEEYYIRLDTAELLSQHLEDTITNATLGSLIDKGAQLLHSLYGTNTHEGSSTNQAPPEHYPKE